MHGQQIPGSTPIPQNIHFIWVGGQIPEKYYRTIMQIAAKAKHGGYQLKIWLDNPENFHKAAEKYGNRSDATFLELCDFRELYNKLTALGLSEEEKQIFIRAVETELVGSRNCGNVSDLLRYAILLSEGGIYCDTDTTIAAGEETTPLQPQMCPESTGLLLPGKLFWTHPNYPLEDIRYVGGSDILSAHPGAPLLKSILQTAIKNYQQLFEAADVSYQGGAEAPSPMDQKRMPILPGYQKEHTGRWRLGIGVAGPGCIEEGALSYLKEHPENRAVIDKYYYPQVPLRVAGTHLETQSDQTWVTKASRMHRSFEAESLPTPEALRRKREATSKKRPTQD